MRRILFILIVGCWLLTPLFADTYWVAFTDKHGTIGTLDIPTTLSARALARRQVQGIVIDSLDLPVSAVYRDSVLSVGATYVHQSRWHNGITIEANESVIEKIRTWQFVREIQCTQKVDNWGASPIHHKKMPATENQQDANILSSIFTSMLRLDSLHSHGFLGMGKQIAVVDNGFDNVNTLAPFAQTTILGTYDFVQPGNDVYLQGEHGTMVLSTMAANTPEAYVGTAPQASYYLLRSEDDATESIREVDAMVAAFEYADSVGADIITSSLGYFYFDDYATDYTYAMHDGKTLRNSMAATIAARKGMLVCVSAGNEGNSNWHYISSPSDADSILTVGAVKDDRTHASFSSFGPTADGRLKPEVCAMGQNVLLLNPSGSYSWANGTSFSCPIIAGMAACLWGALPELTNMEIRERILRFASQYEHPDNILGYGIPNVWHSYLNEATGIIDNVANEIDWTDAKVYDLQGCYLGKYGTKFAPGIYIIKKGEAVKKVQILP